MKSLPTRPTKPEAKWVDYDEDTACWGVFGLDTGFCYSLDADQATAENRLKENDRGIHA